MKFVCVCMIEEEYTTEFDSVNGKDMESVIMEIGRKLTVHKRKEIQTQSEDNIARQAEIECQNLLTVLVDHSIFSNIPTNSSQVTHYFFL